MEDKHIKPLFPVWCHKILPLVYDESLSYYEVLCKIQQKLNEIIESQNNLQDEFYKLKEWIDTQVESYTKEQLQEWLDNGTLENILHSLLNITTIVESVDILKTKDNLVENQFIRTLGFHNINDKGGALYKIEKNVIPNEMDIITLQNELYAVLQDTDINVMKYGCYCNENYDDSSIIRYCIEKSIINQCEVIIPTNTYYLKTTDNTHSNAIFWINSNNVTINCEKEVEFQVKLTTKADYLFNINESEFFTIRNIVINCNNLIENCFGNNKKYCKYLTFENVRINECGYGFNLIAFIGTFRKCLVRLSKVGYRVQPQSNNIATAFLFENCGVYNNTEIGFDLYIVYSTLSSCYCDNTPLPYNIQGRGLTLNGCGCEDSPKALVSSSFRGFVINGFYCQNIGGSSSNPTDYAFEFVSGTDCVISGLQFERLHDCKYKIGLTGNSYGYECITITDLSAKYSEVVQTVSNYYFGIHGIKIIQDEETHKNVIYNITEDNIDKINTFLNNLPKILSYGCYLTVNINTELNLTKPIIFYDFIGNPIIINLNADINMNAGYYAIRFIRVSSCVTLIGNGHSINTAISNNNWRMIEFQYAHGGVANVKFKNTAVNGGAAINSTNGSIVKVDKTCETSGNFGSGSLEAFNEDYTSLIFKR